ncbi:GTPase family protein [Halodurantibacterium flavum]|uniref:GTPase family protein n=1 Tax=Halodurantibacterium flavum TaxID=1382802 RepID=A0ABW4S5X0_9RHOB
MANRRALRRAFLRWDRVFRLALISLSVALSAVLGLLWLYERGWLLGFLVINVVLIGGSLLLMVVLRRFVPRPATPVVDLEAVPADPDWGETERHAYLSACARIETELSEPRDWGDMPALAQDILGRVATEISGGRKGALSFSLPEALLLIDRVAIRYRNFLRRNVPFSDQVSLQTAAWLWRHRMTMQMGWENADLLRRAIRLAINPPVGVVREVERWMAGGLIDRLTDETLIWVQSVLLQEVAHAAVELHSGRLRFTDAELMEIRLGSEIADRQRLVQPDSPVRILLVGQVSAGKSTLINAMMGHDRAETDMAPTTAALAAHETEIEGVPCRLIDGPGLDGTEAVTARALEEMSDCDLVVWVFRANRPGRAVDAALKRAFEARFAADARRRQPPVVAVATCADLLLPGWPWPENALPTAARKRLAEAMAAIEADTGLAPVPVQAEAPGWNIDLVYERIGDALGEALMTQRNRRRVQGQREGGIGGQVGRAARGLRTGVTGLGRNVWRRHGPVKKE